MSVDSPSELAKAQAPATAAEILASYTGTAGRDHFNGTGDADTFDIRQGGNDFVAAGGGDDRILMGATFTAADHLNGQEGNDTVELLGDYSSGVVFQSHTMRDIEAIYLDPADAVSSTYSYKLTLDADTVAPGGHMLIEGGELGYGHHVDVDASAVASGSLEMVGGDDVDTLIGGGGNDTLVGQGGTDILTGGGGANLFLYNFSSESRPSAPDTITDFNSQDRIDLALIDADTKKNGTQHFHFGATPEHAGDIVVNYDAADNKTIVEMFTNHDSKPDMIINLTGHIDLTAHNFVI